LWLKDLYVQCGCGFSAPESWTNFDASPTLRFERLPLVGGLYTKNSRRFPDNVRYGDIVKGLPVPAKSCQAVYCSHILEHLSYRDFVTALQNTKRILKDHGIFRLVVPDLRHCAQQYIADPSGDAAMRFMIATGLGVESSPKNLLQTMK